MINIIITIIKSFIDFEFEHIYNLGYEIILYDVIYFQL